MHTLQSEQKSCKVGITAPVLQIGKLRLREFRGTLRPTAVSPQTGPSVHKGGGAKSFPGLKTANGQSFAPTNM